MEPINIVYTKSEMTVYDLCVDILAIVGGSVATIGVFNSLSHFIFGIKWFVCVFVDDCLVIRVFLKNILYFLNILYLMFIY